MKIAQPKQFAQRGLWILDYPKTILLRSKSHYKWRVENKEELQKSRIAIRLISLLLVVTMFAIFTFNQNANAAINTWTQTDWHNGTGSSVSDQYSSATNLNTSTNGAIALNEVEKVSNGTFNSNTNNWSTNTSEIIPSVVQMNYTTAVTATSFSISLGQVPQEGNVLVLAFNTRSDPGSVSLSGWTQDVTTTNTFLGSRTLMFHKVAGSSESATTTITTTNSVAAQGNIYELAGVDTANPVDQISSMQSGSATSPTAIIPATGTTTQNNEIAIAAAHWGSSNQAWSTITNGFTLMSNVTNSGFSAYKVLTSKQTVQVNMQIQTSQRHQAAMVTFRGATTNQTNTIGPSTVQSNSNSMTNLTTFSATFAATPTKGNTLFAIVLTYAAPGTFTPPSGWTQVIAPQSSTGSTTALFTKASAGASEPAAVTFTTSNAVSGRLDIYEARGIVATNPLDQSVTFTNNNTNPIVVTTGTTTQALEYALGAVGTPNGTGLPGSWTNTGFTLGNNTQTSGSLQSGFKYLTSTQTVSSNLTNGVPRINQGFIATFKSGIEYVGLSRDTATTHSSAGSAKITTSPYISSHFTQSINVGDTNNYTYSAYVKTDGTAVTSSDAQLEYDGAAITTTYTSVDNGWYKLSATVTGENASKSFGISVPANKTIYVDDISVSRIEATGTLTSNIYDTGQLSNWGVLDFTSSGTGTTVVKARSSNSSTMVGASNFAACADITSGSDISAGTNGCVSDAERYIQYQVTLSGDTTTTPSFENININYVYTDQFAPDTNASNIEMYASNGGDEISSNAWTNVSLPYFTWDSGIDNTGGVGVAGYCLYLGTSSSADPVTTKGLLGTGPLNVNNSCTFATADTHLDLSAPGILGTSLTTSNTPYYLLIKAFDSNYNIFTGAAESFHFRFDNTAPSNPAYINAPSSFISTKTATLTWPTGGGDAASDNNSGVAGLQYRIGATGTWYGDDHVGGNNVSDLLNDDGTYTTQDPPDFSNLVEGNNVIYFRTIDNAGNISIATTTTTLKINTSGAPSAPQNVEATPTTNTQNSFAFNWIAPATYVGNVNNLTYCYTINAVPTANNCSFTAAGVTHVNAGAFATQPGTNTFYVVAKDESSSINYATYASADFEANTSAPGMPLNLDIADTSVRATENWKLVISWEEPADLGAGVSNYQIYRSADGNTFSKVGQTGGLSYVDTNLDSIDYSYKIRACDSANNCGAYGDDVTKKPTGRYTTPAELIGEGNAPHVSDIGTRKATIKWLTDRDSDSKVALGIKSGEYSPTESYSSTQVKSHTIQLDNLSPGTTYYYVVRWTDTDGNTGVSSEFAFETLPPPKVLDVTVTGVTLKSATLQYTTAGAASVKIYYGKSSGFGASKTSETSLAESKYIAQLDDLDDGTKYFYKINTFDATGFEYDGTTLSFETPAAPKISNLRFQPVANEPSSTQLITWDTNVLSTTQIAYGVIGGETLNELNATMVTSHEMIIRQLQDDSLYTLTASSRDVNGNTATSDAQTFRTELDTRPPKISEVSIVPSIRGTGSDARGQIIVSWKTDEPATSQVKYGEGATGSLGNSSSQDSRLTLDHAVVISDLSTSKVYRIMPTSFDKGNNEASGEPETAIIGRGTESAIGIVFSVLQKIFGVQP